MNYKKLIIILFIFVLFLIPKVNAEEFKLYSSNALLYNVSENKTMYKKKPNEKVAIASLTKLMTALVLIENINDFNKKIDFSKVDYDYLFKEELATSSLDRNKSYTYDDILHDFLMESSADCGYALVYSVSNNEKEFVKKMNDKAKKIGMKNSSFANPIGLDDKNNYSTMNDMLILMQEVLKNDKLKDIISTFKYKINNEKVHHTIYYYIKHFDLNMPYLKGGKTGHEEIPGYALATYAEKDGCTYILITSNASDKLNKPTHFLDAKKIYDYYFENYGYQSIIEKGKIIKTFKTNGLKEKKVIIKSKKDIKYYLKSDYDKKDIKLKYTGKNKLSILDQKGKILGKINIYYKDKKINTINIVLDKKLHFSLYNFIKQNKYLIIAILCYIIIISSTVLGVIKIKQHFRKKAIHQN